MTVRSAVNSNVIVTVRDTGTGAPSAGIGVAALKTNGNMPRYATTNASGQVTFSLAANTYHFSA